MEVQKRTGEVVTFDSNKIMSAVGKAMARTDQDNRSLPECVVSFVKAEFGETGEPIHVDKLHEVVENALMDAKAFDVAREYVTYRNKNMPDIFRERIAYKPFEYPSLGMYVDAIQQSYWIVTEFGFQSDIQEFKAEMSYKEKEAVRRSMLAISQVEVAVKEFWGNVGSRISKSEVQEVGATFSESECHVAGTEVLTPTGWKDFRDVSVGDDVIQYDPYTEKSSVTDVKHVVNEEYKGDVYSFRENDLQFRVTPNHRFVTKNVHTGEISTSTIEDRNGIISPDDQIPSTQSSGWQSKSIVSTRSYYEGTIHCVTVDSGYIVTRFNDTVLISGNCRHSRAYSHLLEILGLNSDFEKVLEIPAIKRRVDYAQKALAKGKTDSNKDYMESILLFSLFIENVSLFSQFLVISQINKETGMLKGMSNVVAATSLEERTHADFGYELINIIRKENPEWFDEDLNTRVKELVMESFDAEKGIVEWIFDEGELDYISTDETIEYVKNRYNLGLVSAGFDKVFDIDQDKLERVKWFDVQNTATSHTDFFAQRSINYTKADTAFDEDSLF